MENRGYGNLLVVAAILESGRGLTCLATLHRPWNKYLNKLPANRLGGIMPFRLSKGELNRKERPGTWVLYQNERYLKYAATAVAHTICV